MKRVIQFLFFLQFALIGSASASAQNRKSDLINRLGFYTSKQCSLSVEQLKKEFPATYLPPAEWETTLGGLDVKSALIIKRLNSGDKLAVKEGEELIRLVDAIFLENPLIKGKKIGAVRRELAGKGRNATGGTLGVGPSNFQNNSELPKHGWSNQLVEIIPEKGEKKQRVLYTPAADVLITDPEPHFDGKRILFSSIGTNDRWHLFELDLATDSSRQVTPDSYKDFDSFDGCYTPDGRYIFCSTGTFLGLPCTDGGNKMSGLFIFDPRSGKTRQLTFDQDSNWGPCVMNNGQILYQRWEYADLPHSNSRLIFTMNPDGTTQRAYYGSNSYFPAAFFNSRPIPNHKSAFIGTASGHHSIARAGRLLIIDPAVGEKEAEGVLAEVPHYGIKVEPTPRDRMPDGIFPQFLQPYPLSDKYFLVSMRATEKSLWGLYLVDVFNNMTLIAEEEDCAFVEPILIEKQKTPPIIPDHVIPGSKTANVFIQDVYMGDGLKGIPRGTVKKLRIGTYSFSPLGQGGLLGTFGADGPWDVKRIMGTVDVEEDGSAMFTVPANTPIFVQPLDDEGMALQLMRSWFTGMPGETVSCIGCHESRKSIPIPKASLASRKKPQEIREWYGKERGFSYRHEIQPVLDKYCVSCHNGSKPNRPYLKGDKVLTDWKCGISGSVSVKNGGGYFTESYSNLHRYVRRPGIESDIHMLTPMDFHADQTELIQLLRKGHYNVAPDKEAMEKLACWIDYNAPFHGRRSDIPGYERTKTAMELRRNYLEMFGAPATNLEYLPELPTEIKPVHPQKKVPEKGETSAKGWPVADPNNSQLALGYFQMKLPVIDGITLELVKVPAGQFIMGSENNPDEMPQTRVEIEKSFWIGRFEITNKQFLAFDPLHDSRDEDRHGYQFGRRGYDLNQPDQPAVRISWQQAMEYCKWLSQKTGKTISLPTEAQWEWACRAGSSNDYSFGKMGSDYSKYANLGDITLKEYAACTAYKNYESVRILDHAFKYDDWVPRDTLFDDRSFVSERVGRFRYSPWELADMHGNVWEWTRSKYQPYPYHAADGRNETANKDVSNRVVRGGSWYDRPFRATSSYRLPYRDYQKVFNVGFRVVMTED
jgi:formylglycine-generating enzyme required for sulfatase activity